MNIRIRCERLGEHVHCSVFSARDERATHGKNGVLVFTTTEWREAYARLLRFADSVDFVEESYTP